MLCRYIKEVCNLDLDEVDKTDNDQTASSDIIHDASQLDEIHDASDDEDGDVEMDVLQENLCILQEDNLGNRSCSDQVIASLTSYFS